MSAIAAACAHRQPAGVAAPPQPPLANGLYAVVAEGPAIAPPPPGTAGPTGRTFFHDRRKIDPTTDAAPTYVTIDAADFVPMLLERPPESVTQPDGRIRLRIALAREQVEPLAAFTRRHVGGRAAVVLGVPPPSSRDPTAACRSTTIEHVASRHGRGEAPPASECSDPHQL